MWIRIKIDSDLKMGNCRLYNKIHALHNQFFFVIFWMENLTKADNKNENSINPEEKTMRKKSKIKEWNSDRDNAHHFPYKAFRHIVYYPQSEYAKLNRYDCFMHTFTSSFLYYEWRALQTGMFALCIALNSLCIQLEASFFVLLAFANSIHLSRSLFFFLLCSRDYKLSGDALCFKAH